MGQVIQIVGALLILTAFALAQLERIPNDSLAYLILNVLGSGVLAIDALSQAQWGFLLLEGAWCIISVSSLIRMTKAASSARGRRHVDKLSPEPGEATAPEPSDS